MKSLNFFIIVLLCLLSLSCSKKREIKLNLPQKTRDYKIIHNKNQPLDKDFYYKTEKLFTINSENSNPYISFPLSFDVDSKGDIFILDSRESIIYKYNRDGKFLKKFGKKGQGPGETVDPSFLCIINDTIYYGGVRTQNIVICSNEGEFIKKIELPIRNGNPEFTTRFNNDKIISQIFSIEKSEGKTRIRVAVFDKEFQLKNLLSDVSFEMGGLPNSLTPFTCSEDKIYVAHNSDNEYAIDIYNRYGELETTIKKNYHKIEFNDIDFGKKIKSKLTKKSIVGMFYDKKRSLLLVKRSFKRDENNRNRFLVDVFKDNKFINTVDLDIGKSRDFFNPLLQVKIIGDRIYVKNQDLSVYKIKD